MFRKIFFLLILTTLFSPFSEVFSASAPQNTPVSSSVFSNVSDSSHPILKELDTFHNFLPLPTIDLSGFVNNLIKIVLGFVGTIIFLNFLNAGYLLMFSGGDHEKKEQAKQLFSSSIIGLIIMLLSYSLVRFLIQTMLSSSNFGTNL